MGVMVNRAVSVSLLSIATLVLSQTDARPDELSALKAHLVALQSQVTLLETAQVPPLPDRTSNLTVEAEQIALRRQDKGANLGRTR